MNLKSFQNFFILSGGTALGQIIVVVFMPILTRLYTPNEFGLLASYVAILSLLSTASCLRYEIAIPLPKADRVAMLVLVISVILLLFSVVLIFLILLFYNQNLSAVLNNAQISTFFWIIPFGVLTSCLFNISSNWSLRKKSYSTLARTKVIQSTFMVIVQLSMYKFGFISLILGHIIGVSAGTFKLWKKVLNEDSFLIKNFTKRKLLLLAYRYRSFPMFSIWGGLLNCIGTASPTILFASLFDPSVAGFFFVANRVLNAPLSIVGNAIGKQFFAEAPEALRNGTLHCKTKKIILILFLIIIIPALLNLFFAKELFAFFLGNEWSLAGEMSQLLTPMIIAQFITSPVGQLLAVKERLALNMVLQGILTILIITSFVIGYFYLDAFFTVGLYSILSSTGYILFVYSSIKVTPFNNHKILLRK